MENKREEAPSHKELGLSNLYAGGPFDAVCGYSSCAFFASWMRSSGKSDSLPATCQSCLHLRTLPKLETPPEFQKATGCDPLLSWPPFRTLSVLRPSLKCVTNSGRLVADSGRSVASSCRLVAISRRFAAFGPS